MSRRQVLAGAGGTGLLAATASPAKAATRARRSRGCERRHPRAGPPHLERQPGHRGRRLLGLPRPGEAAAGADRAAGHPGRAPPLHRRDQRRDGLDLPCPRRRPAARRHLRLRGDRGQRQQRRRPVQRHVPHRAGGPGAVPLHQLRRPGHAQHRVGALLRPERLRGRGGRILPAAVPPAQRRPVLREPEPHGPARGVARLRQQQPDLGREPALDAVPGQPRGGVLQRPAGLHLLPVPLHPAGQPGARLRRPLVLLPDRLGAVRLARRRRRGLPGRGRVRGRPGGADPGGRHRPPGDQAGHVVLPQGLLRRRADRLAGADAGGRPPGRDGGLDHRPDAPVRRLLLVHRQRLRPRHPQGVAAAVRPVPGGPGALRPRPRLRAVLPGARRRHRRRPRGSHRGGGQHPAPAPGDDHRQRGVRHQARHRAPHPRLRRHRRPAGRVRHRHRRRSAAGQGVHHGRPARRHVHAGRLYPGGGGRGGRRRLVGQARHGHRLRDRCLRRRPGPRARTASPASRSPTTTRSARTRSTRPPAPRGRRPPTTPSSRPSPWSARAKHAPRFTRREPRDTVGSWTFS